MLSPILKEINEQFTLLNIVKSDPSYQVYASGRVQGPEGSKKVLWSPEQWWEAFTFVFCCVGFDGGDDLLFFVRAPNYRGRGMRPYFVKRKQLDLPADLQKGGSRFSKVDWCETVALNLVLQTRYQLNVAVCRSSVKDLVDKPDVSLGEGGVRVSHEVYGSTTKTNLSAHASPSSRNTKPEDCFPKICFAVHDHNETFESLIMTDKDQSYVVMLSAYGGPLSPSLSSGGGQQDDNHGEVPKSESSESYVNVPGPSSMAGVTSSPKEHNSNSNTSDCWETTGFDQDCTSSSTALEPAGDPLRSEAEGMPEKTTEMSSHSESAQRDTAYDSESSTKDDGNMRGEEGSIKHNVVQTNDSSAGPELLSTRVFAGAVDCGALRVYMGNKDPFMRSRTVKMKGPGGHGIADVVITCEGGDLLPPEPAAHTNPLAALQHEMKGLSPKEMLQKSLGMAARAAKDKLIGHSKKGSDAGLMVDLEGIPLQCSLMTLSLPLPRLATEILNAAVP